MVNALRVRSHAKINLDLRVLGRRADGYHELRTIFQTLAWHDTLIVERTKGAFEIDCDMPDVPTGEENLVWKAAAALWRAAGRQGAPSGARVRLRKRIPPQSGLGGGSSNAASALVALDRLWRTRLGRGPLMAVAASLGSDVPFFLVGGTALGLGRGELLYPLRPLPRLFVVVVRPAGGVATADAYRWFAARAGGPSAEQTLDVPGYAGAMAIANDLERAVLPGHPEIAAARGDLLRRGATVALMSGSGSAVFGLFPTLAGARRVARGCSGPSRLVVVTRLAGWSAAPAPVAVRV